MIQNPEFRRHLWLELTPQRMLTTLSFVVVILLLCFTTLGAQTRYSIAALLSLTGFIGFAIFLASFQVSQALVMEVNSNTWQFQRMSSIGPWQMSWGKIFGATIFQWYAASLCMLCYFVFAKIAGWSGITFQILLLIGTALLSQTISFLTTLLALQKRSELKVRRVNLFSFALLFVLAYSVGNSSALLSKSMKSFTIHWHNYQFSGKAFLLLSLFVFVLWGFLGVYRVMRKELMFPNAPWAWVGFVLFLMSYVSGFLNTIQANVFPTNFRLLNPALIQSATFLSKLFLSFVIGVILTYSVLFFEPKDPVVFRRWLKSLRTAQWKQLAQLTPAWAYTLIITCAVLLLAIIYPIALPKGSDVFVTRSKIGCFSLALFMLRDAGMFLFFSFSLKSKRADVAALSYMLMMWIFLPALLQAVSGSGALFLFYPSMTGNILQSVICPLLEVIVVAYLCRSRWQTTFAEEALK